MSPATKLVDSREKTLDTCESYCYILNSRQSQALCPTEIRNGTSDPQVVDESECYIPGAKSIDIVSVLLTWGVYRRMRKGGEEPALQYPLSKANWVIMSRKLIPQLRYSH